MESPQQGGVPKLLACGGLQDAAADGKLRTSTSPLTGMRKAMAMSTSGTWWTKPNPDAGYLEDDDVNGCDLSDDEDSIFDTEDNEPV